MFDVSESYFEPHRVNGDHSSETPEAEIKCAPDLPKVGASGLRLRPLSEVQPRQVRWLVPGLIPLRTLTLVAGAGGLGKSTWLAGIAARLSAGELGEPANVIIVSFEDPAAGGATTAC